MLFYYLCYVVVVLYCVILSDVHYLCDVMLCYVGMSCMLCCCVVILYYVSYVVLCYIIYVVLCYDHVMLCFYIIYVMLRYVRSYYVCCVFILYYGDPN